MRKAILIALAAGSISNVHAQKSAVQSAVNYQKDKDYDQAIEYIEKATKDVSTSGEPKTWLIRGNIYYEMNTLPKYKDNKPYKKAAESYLKVVELKPDYSKDIPTALLNCAISFFNDGIGEFNERKYDESYSDMKSVVDIHNANSGKLFAGNKLFDTISVRAKLMMAKDLYYSNKLDDALVLFNELKTNPVVMDANMYQIIADIYKKKSNDAQWLATVQEGRKAYPNDEVLRADELNYYIKSGKQSELSQHLEDAIAKDPKNAELQYTLGTTYEQMAFVEGARPANYNELVGKAEKAFSEALAIEPNNTAYNYNMGALYINECAPIDEQIDKITGTSAADQKKYDALKAQRDAMLIKAQPYLEKVIASMDSRGVSSLKNDDKSTYIATARALRQIYAKQNKMDKVAEMKKKEDALK